MPHPKSVELLPCIVFRGHQSGRVESVPFVILPNQKKGNMFRSIVLIAALAASCAGMPGNVSVTKSKLDGERQVQVEPGWLYAGGMKSPEMKLGGFWTDKMPSDFIMDAAIVGTDSVTGLKISVDGQISEFKPTEDLTNFKSSVGGSGVDNTVLYVPGHSESDKRFVIPLDFVKKMIAGKKVIVQVQMSRGYREGEFSFNQTSYAKPAFRKAIALIENSN
jgi:hypothetical protein